jgi:hypothetical protein
MMTGHWLNKSLIISLAVVLTCTDLCAQGQAKDSYPDSLRENDYYGQLKRDFGGKKKIPTSFEKEILVALSYFPELKNNRVEFVLRKGYAPLSSRPVYGGMLRSAGKRRYKVFISTSNQTEWDVVLLDKMTSFDARVGIIGHELSHVYNFSHMSGLGLMGVGLQHLSNSKMNKFEYQTDSLTIAKGLGPQLLQSSIWFRKSFGMPDPEELQVQAKRSDYKQRYMGPATIRLYMSDHPFYGTAKDVSNQ